MKVAISTNGNDLDAQVEPAFGRCKYFIIYDTDTNTHEVIPNVGASKTGGAGTTAVQTMVDQGVTSIITGKVGIKSQPLLENAGITISENSTGKIADILSTFKVTLQSEKTAIQQDTVTVKESHQSDRNPAGYCFCSECGYQGDGEPGEPCFKQRCPVCHCGLERKYR